MEVEMHDRRAGESSFPESERERAASNIKLPYCPLRERPHLDEILCNQIIELFLVALTNNQKMPSRIFIRHEIFG